MAAVLSYSAKTDPGDFDKEGNLISDRNDITSTNNELKDIAFPQTWWLTFRNAW